MFQDGDRLVDHVIHVGARLSNFSCADDFFHPARIQVDEIAGAAAEIGEVLDGQTKPARTGRAYHEPSAPRGKMLIGDLGGEFFVIGFVIVPADALLGHAGGAAGFEDIEGSAFELLPEPKPPAANRAAIRPENAEICAIRSANELTSVAGSQPAFSPNRAKTGSRFRVKNASGQFLARERRVGFERLAGSAVLEFGSS